MNFKNLISMLNDKNNITLSQQAKIDSLNKNIEALHVEIGRIQKEYQGMFEGVQGRQKTIDELQGRIDEIVNHVDINFDECRDDDQHSYWSGYNQAMRELNYILKGNKDES